MPVDEDKKSTRSHASVSGFSFGEDGGLGTVRFSSMDNLFFLI
jgi:hypothetical protein